MIHSHAQLIKTLQVQTDGDKNTTHLIIGDVRAAV